MHRDVSSRYTEFRVLLLRHAQALAHQLTCWPGATSDRPETEAV